MKNDLVGGRYEFPAQEGEITVVKINDNLGEEILITQFLNKDDS